MVIPTDFKLPEAHLCVHTTTSGRWFCKYTEAQHAMLQRIVRGLWPTVSADVELVNGMELTICVEEITSVVMCTTESMQYMVNFNKAMSDQDD